MLFESPVHVTRLFARTRLRLGGPTKLYSLAHRLKVIAGAHWRFDDSTFLLSTVHERALHAAMFTSAS